jgi:hypothetical protein
MMQAMNDDPKGLYAALGVEPSAAPQAIAAAFRRKARLLHPDVADTGDAEAFMRVKAAYDLLSNAERRSAYDRGAQVSTMSGSVAAQPGSGTRSPWTFDLPIGIWAGVGGLFCLAAVMAVVTLTRPLPTRPPAAARAFAPSVPAQVPSSEPTLAAVPLTGAATHYVLPAADPAVLWQRDARRDAYVPRGHLADFTPVEALRMVQPHGLVEIRLPGGGSGYVDAARLALGNQATAHRSYCVHNAGPPPENGTVLERHGAGAARLVVDNRGSQPAVLKLRDAMGGVVVSVFVAPGRTATVADLPEADYRPEFAVGELWSRACHAFAAGMRAQRLADLVPLAVLSPLAIPPEPSSATPTQDLPDAEFARE